MTQPLSWQARVEGLQAYQCPYVHHCSFACQLIHLFVATHIRMSGTNSRLTWCDLENHSNLSQYFRTKPGVIPDRPNGSLAIRADRHCYATLQPNARAANIMLKTLVWLTVAWALEIAILTPCHCKPQYPRHSWCYDQLPATCWRFRMGTSVCWPIISGFSLRKQPSTSLRINWRVYIPSRVSS